MKPTTKLLPLLAAASLGIASLHAASPELQASATKLHETHADAVVWLSVIATRTNTPPTIIAGVSRSSSSNHRDSNTPHSGIRNR